MGIFPMPHFLYRAPPEGSGRAPRERLYKGKMSQTRHAQRMLLLTVSIFAGLTIDIRQEIRDNV